MHTSLVHVCLPLWCHFSKKHPHEAEEMLRAKMDAGLLLEDGIPLTGWTGGYIGTSATAFHRDPEVHGLSVVVPLGSRWVERSVLILPEIARRGMWLQARDVVYMNTHTLMHGSTESTVPHGCHRIVMSLFCSVRLLKVFITHACTIERWTWHIECNHYAPFWLLPQVALPPGGAP